MEDNWEEIPEVLVSKGDSGVTDHENLEMESQGKNDNVVDFAEDDVDKKCEELDTYYSKPFTLMRKSSDLPIGLAQCGEDEASSESEHVFETLRTEVKSNRKPIKQQVDSFMESTMAGDDKVIVFMVDGTKTITEDFAHILKDALEQIVKSRNSIYRTAFITQGLQKPRSFTLPGEKLVVSSSTEVKITDGLQELDKEYCAKVVDEVDIPSVQKLLLLENAKPFEVFRYRIAMLNSFFSRNQPSCPCIKIIAGGSDDLLVSIAAGEYFETDIPTLILNTGSKFTKALSSFLQSYKKNSEDTIKREKALIKASKEYYVTEKAVKEMIDELKKNIWKIDVCDVVAETAADLIESIILAISKGINPSISFLMDRTQEVGQNLASSSRYQRNSKILHFPLIQKFPGDEKSLNQELQVLFGTDNSKEYEAIEQQMMDNVDKVFFYNEDTPGNNNAKEATAKRLYNTLQGRMDWSSLAAYDFAVDRKLLKKEFRDEFYKQCPVLGIKKALQENDFKLADYLLKHRPLDIYPYIYFNMQKHWYDAPPRESSNRISMHFKIVNLCERLSKGNKEDLNSGFSGKPINKTISKLTIRLVADFFTEDGRPNLQVFTPIQALMVNRLFNMQLEFVKVLWRYDKRNAMTNGLILWILIKGIIKENIFGDESLVEEVNKLNKLKMYFEEAIHKLLDIAQDSKRIAPADLARNPVHGRFSAFKEKKIFEVAGEVRCNTILSHPLGRRSLPEDWKRPSVESDYRIKQMFASPRSKLYMHMFMYVVCYFLVAYYTLQPKSKGNVYIKGVTFVLIASIVTDEIRQALDNEGTITSCVKAWWSDPWNKLDLISLLIYYVAFILDVTGVPESRILFSTFTFVWCLKFYQYLRAFESLGTYIILIQKMLPHLGNFIVIALVGMIGYGVFMTSIMFPSISFASRNTLLLILFRPYLLLFAEMGINEYGLSSKTTLFGTSKIGYASEILVLLGMCIFLMLGGVLLINLLIAIFSGIYEKEKEKSELYWVINGCHLLREFREKTILPIPFSLPIDIITIIKWLMGCKVQEHSSSKKSWTLIEVEHEVMKDCMMKFVKKEEEDGDSLQKLHDSVMGHVDERMERSVSEISKRISDSVADSNERIGSSVAEINDRVETSASSVNSRLDALEKQNRELIVLLKEMMPSHPLP